MTGSDACAIVTVPWSLVLLFVAAADTMTLAGIDIAAGVGIGYFMCPLWGLVGIGAGSRPWVRLLSGVAVGVTALAFVLSIA
jgi:hypothetical protein